MNKNSGMSTVIAVVLGLIIIAVIGGFVVMNLNSSQMETGEVSQTLTPTPSPVSGSTDTSDLETELEQTTSGSMDSDLETLNLEASSL